MLEELDAQLTPEQHAAGMAIAPRTSLQKLDHFVAYAITMIGACLIVGLLARAAALGGAAFLLSVVLSQPPWLSDTLATYPQMLEMLDPCRAGHGAGGALGRPRFFPPIFVPAQLLFGERQEP